MAFTAGRNIVLTGPIRLYAHGRTAPSAQFHRAAKNAKPHAIEPMDAPKSRLECQYRDTAVPPASNATAIERRASADFYNIRSVLATAE